MSRRPMEAGSGGKPPRRFLGEVLLIGFSGGLYLNIFPGDFIFDDIVLVQEDALIREFNFNRIFKSNYWGSLKLDPNYRPLVLLTYALQHQASGAAWTFRLVNLFLNAAAVWMFYRLCRRLFADENFALAAGFLYASFPVHSEAVVNIVGRAELGAALSIWGAWWLVQRSPRGEGRWEPLAAAGLILLGLFFKENAAAAVALIPLGVYLTRRHWAWRTFLFGGIAVGIYFLIRRLAIGHLLSAFGEDPAALYTLVDNPLAAAPALERIVNATALLGLYAVKILFPTSLSADYSFNQLPVASLSDWKVWGIAVAVAGSALALLSAHRRAPRVALGAAVFLIAIFPTANIAMPIGTLFAERLAYTPSAGMAILIAAALERWREASPSARQARTALGFGLIGLLVILYGARALRRNQDWRDRETMNLRMAEDAPRSVRGRVKAAEGHLILSRKTRDPAEKRQHLQRCAEEIKAAQEIYPEYPHAQAFRCELLLEEGRYAEALQAIDQAIPLYRKARLSEPRVDKLKGQALMGSARLAAAQGREEEAQKQYRLALQALNAYLGFLQKKGAAPDPEALSHRGIARARIGDAAGARADFDLGLLVARDEFPNLYNNRGYLRRSTGDLKGAIEDYERGLKSCEAKGFLFEPADQNVLLFRMRIFDAHLESGDPAAARRQFEAIRALGPSVPEKALKELESRLEKRSSKP